MQIAFEGGDAVDDRGRVGGFGGGAAARVGASRSTAVSPVASGQSMLAAYASPARRSAGSPTLVLAQAIHSS
ncbi:hypothetical protein V2W30_22435 [Streptomyces sp. Q6]|uniref:Uncharacterized protein n=1 Tax=Streptomyces citrinus TaxID=3118173 RepID=A0ACD5AF42_9ACTN